MANNYTNTDILNIFYTHGECNKIIERTVRTFNNKYPHLVPLTKSKFRKIERQFIRDGQVRVKRVRQKPLTENEDIKTNVLAYFHAEPNLSIRKVEADGQISYSSIQRILKNAKMHPFKFQSVQALQVRDYQRRITFCEEFNNKMVEDPLFHQKIIWTDEAKFSRDGITNSRNNHHWASENPRVIKEHNHQDRFSFNVFCMLMDGKVKFQIYYENLNGDKYLDLLGTVVVDFLEELSIENRTSCWYQLDGAPAHRSEAVTEELQGLFEERWIRLNGPFEWPPRSPDLTPLDFYLWGTIKSKVYSGPAISSIEELEGKVRMAFAEITPEEVKRATNDAVRRRIFKCLRNQGQQFEQLL